MNKKCTKCGEEKPLTEFSPHRERRDGVLPNCRVCRATYKANRVAKIRQRAYAIMETGR